MVDTGAENSEIRQGRVADTLAVISLFVKIVEQRWIGE